MRPLYISALALSLAAFQAPTVLAEEGHKHLDAHEHGAGELMVALEGNELLVEMRLSGMDVVGFEHAPENHEQHERVDQALDKLKDATNIVELPAAALCTQEDAHITSPFQDEHDQKNADEHEYEGETHSEFMAEYHFHCEAPQKFDTLSVKAFATFPTLEDVDFQVFGPKGQMGGELEPNNAKIGF
ncbi:DUF2796 domain-containing protein [Magnetovibrio sp. PR-2]|uniref:DUF2796 domain-containing protein n=1 Tax=Magnetovibrio sp. PR-2 TaxID=3120356 RepID=UPI002FCE2161